MKLLALLTVISVTLLLTSCSSHIDQRLVGTWEMKESRPKGDVYRKSIYLASGRYEDSGTISLKDGHQRKFSSSGTWLVDGDTLVETVDKSDFNDLGEYKNRIRFVEPDKVEVTSPDGKSFFIYRAH